MSPLEPAELRRRRRALGLTQAELAERLVVTPNTVARWERGELRIGRPRPVARVLERLERGQRASSRVPEPRTAQASLLPVRHNLPVELTSYVGRDSEIARLVERQASARL